MKTYVRIGAAAFFAVVIAARLAGQTYQNFAGEYQRVQKIVRFRLGPLRILPKFELKSIGYDDNVFFESAGRIAADYTATLSPAVEAYLPLRQRFIIWFRENPEYVYYLRQSQNRGWTNSLSAGVRGLFLSRFVLTWEYTASEYRRPVSSELPVPAKDHSRGWTATLFYETARQTYWGASYGVRTVGYEDLRLFGEDLRLSRVFDREERFARMEFYYRLFREIHFFLTLGRENFRFRYDEGASRDASSMTVRTGLRLPLLGPVRGRLSLGYKRFLPDKAGLAGFSGLIGDTGIEANVGRWGFRVAYGRDLMFSYHADSSFFIDQNLGPGVFFYLTSFLRIGYNLSLGWANYPEGGSAVEAGASSVRGRKDRRLTHSAEIVVRVFRTYGIGITASSMRWNSEFAGFDRARTFVGLTLVSRF